MSNINEAQLTQTLIFLISFMHIITMIGSCHRLPFLHFYQILETLEASWRAACLERKQGFPH